MEVGKSKNIKPIYPVCGSDHSDPCYHNTNYKKSFAIDFVQCGTGTIINNFMKAISRV